MPDGAGLPPNLPTVATARLPAAYEAAKAALAACSRIDECREWADRMEAIASYARQSEDEDLLNQAKRIKGRAVRRCNELLREIPAGKTGPKLGGGAPTELDRPGRMKAALDAGLSRDQTITALRVGNVPQEEFERLVESDHPPTIGQLAELGKQKRPAAPLIDDPPEPTFNLGERTPEEFAEATKLSILIGHMARGFGDVDLAPAVRGLSTKEKGEMLGSTDRLIAWLTALREELIKNV